MSITRPLDLTFEIPSQIHPLNIFQFNRITCAQVVDSVIAEYFIEFCIILILTAPVMLSSQVGIYKCSRL